jgi:hypothetical protein
MINPYEPPSAPNKDQQEPVDPDWIYREMFGYAILILVVGVMLDSLMQALAKLH